MLPRRVVRVAETVTRHLFLSSRSLPLSVIVSCRERLCFGCWGSLGLGRCGSAGSFRLCGLQKVVRRVRDPSRKEDCTWKGSGLESRAVTGKKKISSVEVFAAHVCAMVTCVELQMT